VLGCMHRRRFLILTAGSLALARSASSQLEDLLEAGHDLLEEHLDPAFLRALNAGDFTPAETLLRQTIESLQGDYVIDLAALQQTVGTALTLLDAHPETRSYASWLRARIDYFEIARFFDDTLPSSPPRPGQPRPPRPIPTPEQQRKAWQRDRGKRPAPQGATDWAKRLKPVFRRAGAPPGLVWLAEIESSFDPQARSPVGAAGLFQLMPATATELGLKLAPDDERLVPEKNARAAATYLRQLHRRFSDWPLVLAAYNAGPGRVSQLLKTRRARSFDAIAPSLPAETQMYVPKFEAVLRQREGVALKALPAPATA
jgi:membrane-bound lytic murein transglycosylase D